MASVSISIDPPSSPSNSAFGGGAAAASPTNGVKRESFIPLALAQEKLISLQTQLHAADQRHQRAIADLQLEHAQTMRETHEHFDVIVADLRRRGAERDAASQSLLRELTIEAQKQRAAALISIQTLERRIDAMIVEHRAVVQQRDARHARDLDRMAAEISATTSLAAGSGGVAEARTTAQLASVRSSHGDSTVAEPVSLDKFPNIAAASAAAGGGGGSAVGGGSAGTTELEARYRGLQDEMRRTDAAHEAQVAALQRELHALRAGAVPAMPPPPPSPPTSSHLLSDNADASTMVSNAALAALEQQHREQQHAMQQRLDAQTAELTEARAALSTAIAASTGDADAAARSHIAQLDTRLAAAHDECDRQRAQVEQLRAALDSARAQAERAEKNAPALAAAVTPSVAASAVAASHQSTASDADLLALRAQLAERDGAIARLNEQLLHRSSTEVAAIATATATAPPPVAAAADTSALETDLRLVRTQLVAEQTRAHDATAELGDARATIDALQRQLSELTAAQAGQSAASSAAAAAAAAAAAERDTAAVAAAERERARLETELGVARAAAAAEVAALQRSLDDAVQRAADERAAAAAADAATRTQLDVLEGELRAAKARASSSADAVEQQARAAAEAQRAADEARAAALQATELASKANAIAADAEKRAAVVAQQLAAAQQAAAEARTQAETAESALREEQVIRKRLRNELEDLKGKVRVYCRVRPPMGGEIERGDAQCVSYPDIFSIKVERKERDKTSHFEFDSVFSPAHHPTQEDVFEETKGLAESTWNGFNVCIFAYGQTGSGKTWTMGGGPGHPGLKPRFVHEIFRIADESKRRGTHTVVIQSYMLEIYKDVLYDLYARADRKEQKPIEPRKDENGVVVFQNAHLPTLTDAEQMLALIERAEKTRAVASTDMNAGSSRSHLIMAILIRKTEIVRAGSGEQPKVTFGKLSLVDLAGSESVKKTNASKERLQEALSINKSLSALSNVMSILAEPGQHGHVPYRSNVLTRAMEDSLGNNAKTLMFVNVSPSAYNAEETHNSLTYAALAKKITNKATADVTTASVARIRAKVQTLQRLLADHGIAIPGDADEAAVEDEAAAAGGADDAKDDDGV